ncbi:MAG TPA: class I SAM-dependent methyltransferase [Vicinamibacteria bacterium]|nr:class I SAM-dependent methyltransferase [Vicinamibacteria bacterium]
MSLEQDQAREYYDDVYHREPENPATYARHFRRLAARLALRPGERLLDVACGTGGWLLAAEQRGARVAGVDISTRAIAACRQRIRGGEFHSCAAEELPFADGSFDVVSCLGALEHMLDPCRVLDEMRRVGAGGARFVLLVPNAGFLTRRLGLYSGTGQTALREDVRTLAAWRELFESSGLRIQARWKDLHPLSWSWIGASGLRHVPLRAAQAAALLLWPLEWQYQVYFLCRARP